MTSRNIKDYYNRLKSAKHISKINETLLLMKFENTDIKFNHVNVFDFEYGAEENIKFFTRMSNTIQTKSEHPSYKVGSVIVGKLTNGKTFFIPTVNQTPDLLKSEFPITDTKAFANSSSSDHAERIGLNILSSEIEISDIESLKIFTSKTCCPSCYKMISIFGNRAGQDRQLIDGVYTDGKTLSGEYEKENSDKLSPLELWKKARRMLALIGGKGGLTLNLVRLDSKRKPTVKAHRKVKTPEIIADESNLEIEKLDHNIINKLCDYELLAQAEICKKNSPFENKKTAIAAIAFDKSNDPFLITANNAFPPGFVFEKDRKHLEENKKTKKQSYNIRANALEYIIAGAWANNLKVKVVASTEIPVSGTLITAINNGLEQIYTSPGRLDIENNQDHLALHQLKQSGLLNHKFVHSGTSKHKSTLHIV